MYLKKLLKFGMQEVREDIKNGQRFIPLATILGVQISQRPSLARRLFHMLHLLMPICL